MESIQALHGKLIGYLKEGKFAEGIADFYHDDVVAQENADAPSHGRDAMVAAERQFLKKVTKYHGLDVHATVVDDHGHGNGVVFYETTMKWEQNDRNGVVKTDQAVVERWKDGKISSIRFYGTYNPGPLPQ